MKKSSQVDEAVNPLSSLAKLKSAYQTYKYGTTLPKEIEAIKQAKLDTELKKAQVKLAKQGKLPAAADDAAAAEVKPKGVLGKAADIVKYPFQNKLKTAAGATAAATGYEYLKDPKADIGTLVGRGVKDVVDVGTWAGEKALKFGSDVVRGYTGTDTQVADKDKETKDRKEPQAARPSDIEIQPLPTKGIGFDQLRERSLNKVLDKYELFLNEESEQQKKDRERLQALQRGIYGQESGYGKAKTDKPNYAGARGPMQITPGTFKWMKDSNIIPKDYDIKNPEQNKAAGDALIGHYYTKYQGDPAKVAAAYYAGPGAINKDGTINTHWRDRKNSKAPNVGQYIDSTLGKSGIKDITYTAAKPSAFKIPSVAAATNIDQPGTKLEPKALIPTTTAASDDAYKDVPIGGLPKFDWEAFRQAARSGEDVSKNTERFNIPATPTTKTAGLAEAYKNFKLQEKAQGTVGAELAKISGGQFATKADRLDQAKVDAALGPGFRAGSKEANLALAQKFRTQPAQSDQSGQAGRPSPSNVVPAVRGAENLTPYTTAADVAGTAGLAALGGQFLPKVGGVVAKAVPGLNVAYQGADALRRASIGDTTGSAISAAGAVPVLGIPAVAAQAVRDKFRTGSFFPSDEELKTAVDRDRGVAPTPAATSVPQAATPQVKEGIKMNKKQQLQQRIKKLEETKAQLQERFGSFARAGAKFGGALKSSDFGKMLTGLGSDLKPPADVTRKAGQTFDRVRGTGSSGDAMVQNRRTGEVLPLSDIGKTGTKSPAVWRKGGDTGAATTASKAAGAADDVAAAAAKGGKPLGRGTTAALAALGGGAVGLGLGMGGDDKKPEPGPEPVPVPPGPAPAPRPTPVKPSPEKPPYDIYQPRSDDSDNTDSSDYRRYKPIKTEPVTPEPTKPTDSDDNIDVQATADRDRISQMVNKTTNESLNELLRLSGLAKK